MIRVTTRVSLSSCRINIFAFLMSRFNKTIPRTIKKDFFSLILRNLMPDLYLIKKTRKLHRSVSSQNMSVTALRIPVNALTHVGNGSADKSEGNLTQAPRRSTRTDREQNAFTTAFFETLLHKPAREQGRNSQLECLALAYTRACAFALRVSPWYLPIAGGLRCFVVEFYSI